MLIHPGRIHLVLQFLTMLQLTVQQIARQYTPENIRADEVDFLEVVTELYVFSEVRKERKKKYISPKFMRNPDTARLMLNFKYKNYARRK